MPSTLSVLLVLFATIGSILAQSSPVDFFERGNKRATTGDTKGAVEDWNRAIELDSKFADAYYNLGLVHYNSSDFSGAIEYWNKAIAANPKHTDAYYNRARAYIDIKQYEKALIDLNKVIELDPALLALT